MKPHVFVAMPFGSKAVPLTRDVANQDAVRHAADVNFDLVYERLIAPALGHAGCVPFRADEEAGAGDIRTDMFFELVTADAIVADVSVLNANVFYELGVRHGARPSGVFMIHGGWQKAPFDIASDRRFEYDGSLFLPAAMHATDEWQVRLEQEAARLGNVLRDAFAADTRTVGSPVYKELVGLKPADWTGIKTARARYFGDVFADWKARVDVAKLNGWPGDILTLADDAPTRFHRVELLWHAADALCSMQRFEAALQVARDLLALEPGHRKALTRLGLILAKLGKPAEARVHMLQVAEELQGDVEAQGILGRVYKDLWCLEWEHFDTLAERQAQAIATSAYIGSAVCSYDEAARQKFDFWNGINVVSFVRLLEFLADATGEEPVGIHIDDIDLLAAMVRFCATNTLASKGRNAGEHKVWAAATLGELELVLGNKEKALSHYRAAVLAPEASYFNVSSMLDQIHLFDRLGFRRDDVAAAKKLLEDRANVLEKKFAGAKRSMPRFANVFIASGHMIDAQNRETERFPPRKEGTVSKEIEAQLAAWNIGPNDLAICGGASGADILFAEIAVLRGAEVWLMLALPEAAFLDESIRMRSGDWEQRYYQLRNSPRVKLVVQQDRLKAAPKGQSVFARNNTWMINTARVEIRDTANLYAIIVWDGNPAGDGPGGTADFDRRIRELGGRRKIIDPASL